MSMYLVVGLMVAVVIAAVVLAMALGRNMAIICAVAGLLMVGMTFLEAQYSDRWASSNVSAEEFAKKFAKVPKTIGKWEGTDLPVDEQVRRVAGAVGYVSREYEHSETGDKVTLWLIVGHSRDICRHTPDICYPSSGFHKQSRENIPYTMVFGDKSADFWTNSFILANDKGRGLKRVFWTWYKPGKQDGVNWEAPEYQRWHFGNARALYKMYFSNQMPGPTQTAEQSPCIEFAEEFLPTVEDVLMEKAA